MNYFFLVLVNNNYNNNVYIWVIKCSLSCPGVAPFSGATTGTGGRIRDVQSAGKGGHVIAGTAGYCFGNLHIPGKPWNSTQFILCHILFCKQTFPYLDLFSSQGLCSRGRRKGGSTRPALLLHSRWPLRPVMEPLTTEISLGSQF